MKGKKDTSPAEVSFPSATIAAYRKIAANIYQLARFDCVEQFVVVISSKVSQNAFVVISWL
jgi:hypothetical protein